MRDDFLYVPDDPIEIIQLLKIHGGEVRLYYPCPQCCDMCDLVVIPVGFVILTGSNEEERLGDNVRDEVLSLASRGETYSLA